jgi:hypothetical protein
VQLFHDVYFATVAPLRRRVTFFIKRLRNPMPTTLPPRPVPTRFGLAGWARANTIACMLLWRFRVANVLRSAAIRLGYVAAVLTHRKWRPGVWLFKLATGLLVAERRIRPDLEGAFLSQYLRRPEKPRAN